MHTYNKGNALARLGRYEEALECFNKALDINPKYDLVPLQSPYEPPFFQQRTDIGSHVDTIPEFDQSELTIEQKIEKEFPGYLAHRSYFNTPPIPLEKLYEDLKRLSRSSCISYDPSQVTADSKHCNKCDSNTVYEGSFECGGGAGYKYCYWRECTTCGDSRSKETPWHQGFGPLWDNTIPYYSQGTTWDNDIFTTIELTNNQKAAAPEPKPDDSNGNSSTSQSIYGSQQTFLSPPRSSSINQFDNDNNSGAQLKQ